MRGRKLLLSAIWDEFKTLMLPFRKCRFDDSKSKFSVSPKTPAQSKQPSKAVQQRNEPAYEAHKMPSRFRISPNRKSIFHSGWVQNTVVALAILFLTGLIGGVMKNPKIIIVFSAIGLTVIVWFIAIALLTEYDRPKDERAVQFDSRIARNPSDNPYPTNLTIGGVTFDKSKADVRFTISPKKYSIKNLDFSIGFDRGISPAVIFNMGQVSSFRGVTFIPPEIPTMMVKIKEEDGQEMMIPLDAGAAGLLIGNPFGPVWRVHCDEILHDSTLELILKVGQAPPPGTQAAAKWSPTVVEAWGSFDAEGENGVHSVPFHIKQMLKGKNPN